MKTTHDLMEALIRLMLEHSTAPPEAVEMKIQEFRRTFCLRPPEPLTDQQFESQIAQVRKEMPAFLRDLGV